MYKSRIKISIILLIALHMSCSAQKTIVKDSTLYVYKGGKRISPLIKNVYHGDCSECYVHQTLTVFDKKITFTIPVYQHANRFDQLYSITKNKEDDSILKINSQGTGIHYYTLYFSKKKSILLLKNSVEILKEDVRIKLGTNDYEHVTAMRICKFQFHKILPDTIPISEITKIALDKKQCTNCLIEDNNFENCFSNAKEQSIDNWSGIYILKSLKKDSLGAVSLDTLVIKRTTNANADEVPSKYESDLERWTMTSKRNGNQGQKIVRRFLFDLRNEEDEYKEFGWTDLYIKRKMKCIDGGHFFICQTKPNSKIKLGKDEAFFTKTGVFGIWLHFGLVSLQKIKI